MICIQRRGWGWDYIYKKGKVVAMASALPLSSFFGNVSKRDKNK
jgi:hypothetical protein